MPLVPERDCWLLLAPKLASIDRDHGLCHQEVPQAMLVSALGQVQMLAAKVF